jgi:acetylornithine deacetylase
MTDSTLALLERLIAIDSANPDLGSGPGETAIADFTTDWLTRRGFECHRLEARAGRPSVVGVHAGTGGGRSLMLNGHLDTVTLASYDGDGLTPRRADGRLYGRGAYDMKSGLAAMMTAAAEVAARPHRGDVVLALVADEEYASAGTEEVLRHFGADAAIVAEPTEQELVVAHRGFAWFDVIVHGRAAHGSRRDLGVDAIAGAGRFLVALADHDRDLAGRTPHPLLGTGNIHASLISGGEEYSSYPASCTVSLERRTLPGEDATSVAAELHGLLAATAADPSLRYELRPGLARSPFAVDAAEPIVGLVRDAHRRLTGQEVVERGEAFWTDAALLADAGIPAVLYGVRGGGAHAAAEWVEEESLHSVTAVLAGVVAEFTR